MNREASLRREDSPFGILEFLHWAHPWNNQRYSRKGDLKKAVSLMREINAGWIRMDFLWQDIEPRSGRFRFDKYDSLVDLLTENGIKILGILNYSVPWAASNGQWNNPPGDLQWFVNYAAKTVSRYKDRIKYWEVWNEPDSAVYWSDQDGMRGYCRLLKKVYTALKKIDPDCKILNGGLANGTGSVSRLYANRAKDYFDILNIHIFESPLDAQAIKRVAAYPRLASRIMRLNGDTHKKIWVTEIGCPGVKRGLKTGNWWLGKNPGERQQARWLKDVYAHLLPDTAVQKVFWAFFRDTRKHWDNGVDYFGLLRPDFSPKPAFAAYKSCFHDWKKSRKD